MNLTRVDVSTAILNGRFKLLNCYPYLHRPWSKLLAWRPKFAGSNPATVDGLLSGHKTNQYIVLIYEGKVESSSLAYKRRETRDKRPLGSYPDRGWCHATLGWNFLVAAYGSMVIGGSIRGCWRSVRGAMGCDQGRFTLVWWWHQLLSGSLHNILLSRLSRRL